MEAISNRFLQYNDIFLQIKMSINDFLSCRILETILKVG